MCYLGLVDDLVVVASVFLSCGVPMSLVRGLLARLIGSILRLVSKGVNRIGGSQRSVEFAFAFHVGEQSDDGLFHPDERLGRESVPAGPGVELGGLSSGVPSR